MCQSVGWLVGRSVGRSVGLSVTLVSPPETAELIEMLFGLRTWVSPGNHLLYGGPDLPWEGAKGKRAPIVKYRDTLQSPVQKRLHRSSCRLDCDLGMAQGIRN